MNYIPNNLPQARSYVKEQSRRSFYFSRAMIGTAIVGGLLSGASNDDTLATQELSGYGLIVASSVLGFAEKKRHHESVNGSIQTFIDYKDLHISVDELTAKYKSTNPETTIDDKTAQVKEVKYAGKLPLKFGAISTFAFGVALSDSPELTPTTRVCVGFVCGMFAVNSAIEMSTSGYVNSLNNSRNDILLSQAQILSYPSDDNS